MIKLLQWLQKCMQKLWLPLLNGVWRTQSIFVNGDYARHRSSLLGSMDLLVAIRQVCQIKQN